MIKAKGEMGSRPVLLLGLSFKNLDRLRDDQPIVIHKEEIDVPFDIVIFSQETEEVMAKTMSQYFTKDAVITGSTRRRPRH